MKDFFEYLDLNDFPKIDRIAQKDDIIKATKILNSLFKEIHTNSKLKRCYYCGNSGISFCNSHTLPAFCLRNIAQEGKIFYINSILDLPTLKESKGVNEAGTFRMICRDCDSKIFQEYENPDNYKNIPTTKMLAQIDMKSNLKNISKSIFELELHSLIDTQLGINEESAKRNLAVTEMDLSEHKDNFNYAKRRAVKPFDGDYCIGYYKMLPYVVPVAFQGTISMIFDLEGNVINNIYSSDPKYKIKNVNICIFPLNKSSIIMLFVGKKNKRYSQFFRQLKKFDLQNQLSIINYILFSYGEDYFLSINLDREVLNKLKLLSGKTPQMKAFYPTNSFQQLEGIRKIYNFDDRFSTPNLLSDTFALSNEINHE